MAGGPPLGVLFGASVGVAIRYSPASLWVPAFPRHRASGMPVSACAAGACFKWSQWSAAFEASGIHGTSIAGLTCLPGLNALG